MHSLRIIPLLLALIANQLHQVYCQCSGTTLVLYATDVYQVFTSLNYPSGYSNLQSCEWRIEADDFSDAIRLEITDADIEYHPECVHDYGEVFDGDNVNATSLGKFCGTESSSFVSFDSNMTVTFSSDYSMSKKGFKARYKCGPRSSLVDDTEENSSLMIFIIAGAAGGVAIIVLIISIVIHKKAQAKKAKDVRAIHVQPFAVASTWSHRNHHHHPPPVYGDGNVSTISPPPRYSDIGLHPPPTIVAPAGQFDPNNNSKPGDAVKNSHFVMPDNLRRMSTQLGNTTSQSNGVLTTDIRNSAKPDSLPNEDTALTAGDTSNVQTGLQSGNAVSSSETLNKNGGEAVNNLPVNGTKTTEPSTDRLTVNNPVNLLSLPRRNAPGETLSEVLSESEDDSETDSDEYYDSDD